jgi:hypothetical protein
VCVQMIEGDGSTTLMNHDRFFAIFNMHTFLGDTISRMVAYYFEPRNPMLYLVFTILGSVLASLKMPILMWPGLFAIFFANGAIYATTTRFIDQQVHKDFNLISLSFWLFIGDVGSVVGANTWCVRCMRSSCDVVCQCPHVLLVVLMCSSSPVVHNGP